MRKLLLLLSMLMTVSITWANEIAHNPANEQYETPAPVIAYEEMEDGVLFVAFGEGVITLHIEYIDEGYEETAEGNGEAEQIVYRASEDRLVRVWATAQLNNDASIGVSEELVYVISGLEDPVPDPDPHNIGCWIVLYDKYGEEIWKPLPETWGWNNEMYYSFTEYFSLDLKTYSVIDYYTETPPYKPVQSYIMIDGVRFGPETPDVNPLSGSYVNFGFVDATGCIQPLSPQEENCFAFPAGYSCSCLAVKDGQLYVGDYPATGLMYDTKTCVVLTDKNGNTVEYETGSEVDLDPETFGSSEYNGYVPFHLVCYKMEGPFVMDSHYYGAEVDGIEAIFGIPFAQKLQSGKNNFLVPVGYTYKFGMFENYLYALQVGRVANCTDENTSFTVNKLSIRTGDYFTFRANVGLKAEYKDRVSDMKLVVQMPSSCLFYDNSVMVGDEICSNYTVESNMITIPLSDYSQVVRFCAIPTEAGDYVANANLLCTLDGEIVREPIGLASFYAFDVSMMVPPVTASPDFMVHGTAARGSKVTVYVDDVQVAQTNCLANGSWRVECRLNQPGNPSTHWVYATVVTQDGNEYGTDTKEIMYVNNNEIPHLDKITMYYNGSPVVFDFVKGTTAPREYYYATSSKFTFVAKLNGITESVSNLKLKVLDTSGKVITYDGVYAGEGSWVFTASYPYTNKLPTSVGVVYDYVWSGNNSYYETIFTNYTNGVTPNVIPIIRSIDPSGFVYEAVPSNRLQGVTTTCYYKDSETSERILWDASQYEQENPLLTDEQGFYRWDVPIGLWQVKYEKEGYQTVYSEWLPVPPPQLDVNIGMTEMRQPEVIKARAYPNAVELEFNKYMKPETLTTGNITVSVNGTPVSGTIQLLNEEAALEGGQSYASRVRFNALQPFNANKVTLRVKHEVENYAGLQMAEDYVKELDVEAEMTRIVTAETIDVPWGKTYELIVSVEPAAAANGKTLTVRSTSPMILSTAAETYTLDENGKAVVRIHGDLPGEASLMIGIEGYDLTATTLVNVNIESDTGLKGDVNGDGEVNIADVNVLIDIILGGNADAETYARADVNNDREVNIADINVLIDIILSPGNYLKLDANCNDRMHLDDLTMRPGDVRTMSVTIDNASRYSAMQCDISLPDGLTLVDVNATAGSVSKAGMLGGASTRAVAYSMNKQEYVDNAPVLTLTVKAGNDFVSGGELTMTNIVLADNANNSWRMDDCVARVVNVSCINDLTAGNDRVWVEGNILCIETGHDSLARIVEISGVMHDLKVKNGVTRHQLDKGIYVIVLNGRSHKIAIR